MMRGQSGWFGFRKGYKAWAVCGGGRLVIPIPIQRLALGNLPKVARAWRWSTSQRATMSSLARLVMLLAPMPPADAGDAELAAGGPNLGKQRMAACHRHKAGFKKGAAVVVRGYSRRSVLSLWR